MVHALLLVRQHRARHVGIALGLEEGKQRMLGAISIPEGEDGVMVEALSRVDIAVEAAILSVHVHVDAGIDHRVIERGVEHAALVGRTFATKGREGLVPNAACLIAELFKRLAVRFGPQIAQGSLRADGRKGHTKGQSMGGIVCKVEVGHGVAACHLGKVVLEVKLAPESAVVGFLAVAVAVTLDGFAQGNGEIGVVAARPSAGDAIAREEGVVLHANAGPEHLAVVVVDAMSEVEDDALFFARGVSIAVNAHPRSGSQLHAHLLVV